MNIFALNKCPVLAAQCHCDRHVIKMMLESAQLLSSATRFYLGKPVIKIDPKTGEENKFNLLPKEKLLLKNGVWVKNQKLAYETTHLNHPCSKWARECVENYCWLIELTFALEKEWQYRWRHKRQHLSVAMLRNMPSVEHLMPTAGKRTTFALAMDKKYIIAGSSVKSYKNYYGKGKVHLHKWTRRKEPCWLKDYV